MKFYTSELVELIQKIEKGSIKALLMHGVNQGFITTAITQIAKKVDLIVNTIVNKELTPEKLSLLAYSQNFFGKKALIKIIDINPTLDKDMKELIKDNTFYNFVCFVASDLLSPNGIRKFFEDQSELASVACYYDNEQTIAKIILQECKKYKKSIEKEALFYLKSHLKGDHQIIKSELKKLFNFTHDKSIITKEDIHLTLSSDLLASAEEMCLFFGKKEPIKFLKEVQKLKEQNKNEVLMIRALLRYYMNIYTVTLKLEKGENIDKAIKSLSPPIFFKYIDEFKQVVYKSSSSDALFCLETVQNAEINYKINPKVFDLFKIYIDYHERN